MLQIGHVPRPASEYKWLLAEIYGAEKISIVENHVSTHVSQEKNAIWWKIFQTLEKCGEKLFNSSILTFLSTWEIFTTLCSVLTEWTKINLSKFEVWTIMANSGSFSHNSTYFRPILATS